MKTSSVPTILITGATGNVGLEVIKALCLEGHEIDVVAGVRDPVKTANLFGDPRVRCIRIDLEDNETITPALQGVDILFLLRPPHLSDVERYFKPLLGAAKVQGVQQIVFLSVQGVENSSIIPHHKIEALISASGIPYTFLRPAYFMQNFTTTLRKDLVQHDRIFLPAGNARFTLIDVADIGRVAAKVLMSPKKHTGCAYDLTNSEKLSFHEMAEILSLTLGRKITYTSPGLVRFFVQKRKEKMPVMLILVMIMLHYLPRFQKEPPTTRAVLEITGQEAATFEDFAHRSRCELAA